jgi:TIR domain
MSRPHNVFISWSGERSRAIAEKLREWLPRVVQAAKPWMSEADIEKGSRGLNELMQALDAMKVGIVCLTPDNLETPWLLFEAGALSKAVDNTSRVCTYLLDGLEPVDVKAPLGMFQATKATREDTGRLIRTVNGSVSEDPLREEDLNAIFDAMWPSLEEAINSLPLVLPTKRVKRSADDMLAEILEMLRAQANRSAEAGLLTFSQLEAIRAEVAEQRFLSSIIEHASRWELGPGELRVYFPRESRALAEMLQARDPMEKLRSVVGKVLGKPMRVCVKLEASL